MVARGGSACGWDEWLCRVAEVDYRGTFVSMPQNAGAGLPERLFRDLPISTVLTGSTMCTLELRDTALQ
jgi:hypothetical protein